MVWLIRLKVHQEVTKLMTIPATPTEWKKNHIFLDQSHNQWISRSDTVHFQNNKTRISLSSVDMVTNSKRVRSWVINDSDILRCMNLIVTARVSHDQSYTTASDITLISHRCDSNIKRSIRQTILQQLRGLNHDERIVILNDYTLDELNTSTHKVMKFMMVPMITAGAYLLHLRIL